MLDDMRREFADFLANDPAGRWRMDAALAHVVALAYRAGLVDGAAGPVGHEEPRHRCLEIAGEPGGAE